VLANDLNPHCFHYLNINNKLNKIEKKIKSYNMDAREFLVRVAKNENELGLQFRHFDHIYMNLPADAVEFLDVFKGFLHYANKDTWNVNNLPMIHVYGFESGEEVNEVKDKFVQRIKAAMDSFEKQEITDFHHIKDVSTHKKMYCVSFKLSKEVALLPQNKMLNLIINFKQPQEEETKEDPDSHQPYEESVVKKVKTS